MSDIMANMLKGKEKNLQKILKESAKAVSTVVRNREIIETIFSIQEIKSGKYKKFASSEQMFEAFGI